MYKIISNNEYQIFLKSQDITRGISYFGLSKSNAWSINNQSVILGQGTKKTIKSALILLKNSLPATKLNQASIGVCLGSGWDHNKEGMVIISGLSRAVMDRANELLKENVVKKLLLTGQNGAINPNGQFVSEKQTMYKYALSIGIDKSKILLDPTNANSTQLQINYLPNMVSNLDNVEKEGGFILVDISLHALRTWSAAKKSNLMIQMAPVYVYDSPRGKQAQTPYRFGMHGYIIYERILRNPLVANITHILKVIKQRFM